MQRERPAATNDGEGFREQLCKGVTGAAAAGEVSQQLAPPHREPAPEGTGEWEVWNGGVAVNAIGAEWPSCQVMGWRPSLYARLPPIC